MERKMRRSRQLLDAAVSRDILSRTTNAVLSLADTDGEPYGVPVSFAFDADGSVIYIHSAVSGRKMECIAAEPRCSLCVVDQDRIMPLEFTTYFRSVIAAGRISHVTDVDEIMRGLSLLCRKYSPGVNPHAEIARCLSHVAVLRIDVASITGKQVIELVRPAARNAE